MPSLYRPDIAVVHIKTKLCYYVQSLNNVQTVRIVVTICSKRLICVEWLFSKFNKRLNVHSHKSKTTIEIDDTFIDKQTYMFEYATGPNQRCNAN